MNSLYTKEGGIDYLKNNPTWDVEDSPWKTGLINLLFERNKLTYLFKNIAEVGCGAGEILNQLYSVMPDNTLFWGYDISQIAIDIAKKREKDRLKYHCCNIFETDMFFDCLLVIDVIEHIPDYYGFLEKCKHKATYKIFHIPLDMHIVNLLFNRFSFLNNKSGHIHYFSFDSAIQTLQNNGYEIIDFEFTNTGFAYLNPKRKVKLSSRIAVLPRLFLSSILGKNFSTRLLGGHSLLVLTK
jgi:hypothetical protein